MYEKNNKMPEFYVILARKIIKIPEFFMIFAGNIKKIRNFTRFLPEKMPEFYKIIARKIFFPNFGEGTCPPCPCLLRLSMC